MLPIPPKGMPHPRSEYAKRMQYLATCEPLSIAVQNQLILFMKQQGLILMNESSNTLKYVRQTQDGVCIYEGNIGNQFVVKGTTVMRGSVSELLGQLRRNSTSTHDCRRSLHAQFLRTFCHSTNLDQIANIMNDGLHVHWLALRGDGMHSTPIDAVFSSYSQQYIWDDSNWRLWTPQDGNHFSQEAGTHVWESINTHATPPFDGPTTGCVRYHIENSGFIVEKCTDLVNYCNVSFMLKFQEDPSREWMHELVSSFSNFIRPDPQLVVPSQLWSYEDRCNLCIKTFRIFRRRHHCRLCGHAICSKCSLRIEMGQLSTVDKSLTKKTSILSCFQCNIHVKTVRHSEMYEISGQVSHDVKHPTASLTYSGSLSQSTSRISILRESGGLPHSPILKETSAQSDYQESTFTIHAPTASLPYRCNSLPPRSTREDFARNIECDVRLTIHNRTTEISRHHSESFHCFSMQSIHDTVDRRTLNDVHMDREFACQRRSNVLRPLDLTSINLASLQTSNYFDQF